MRVLDAGDNPHCQHFAVSSGRQARRRTFVPRKTTAIAAFHPTRQARRRGCQFPAARTWLRGAAVTAELPSDPHDGAQSRASFGCPALRGRRLAGVAFGGHRSLLAGKMPAATGVSCLNRVRWRTPSRQGSAIVTPEGHNPTLYSFRHEGILIKKTCTSCFRRKGSTSSA